MSAGVELLQGQFVVEVGVRQAWPFLTFCEPSSPVTTETRLYIGTTFRLEPGERAFEDGDPQRAAVVLLDLNNRTVTHVETRQAELGLSFDDGERMLVVDGTPASFTTHDVWWLGGPGGATA